MLTMLSITAAANWKLFAFYGKYVQNRPSKKRSSRTLQVNCVQWDCAFFAWSCRALLFALVLAGSWSGPGCSAILEYSAFLLPNFLHDSTLFTEDSVCPLNFFVVLQQTKKKGTKLCLLRQKKDVPHVVKKNHCLIFTIMSQNQTDTILFVKIVKS